MSLSPQDRQLLHEIARGTITGCLEGKTPPGLLNLPPILRELRGAFVTLHKHGQLRGCIGLIEAIKPLAETVQEMAMAAAFRDPRFPPLQSEELPDIEIEISVLTPFRQITDVGEIEVGKHGLYIEKGYQRGLLLPQVATEYKWDRDTFLRQTCLKAGLHPEAWKDPDSRIFVFSAEIF